MKQYTVFVDVMDDNGSDDIVVENHTVSANSAEHAREKVINNLQVLGYRNYYVWDVLDEDAWA